MQCLPCRKPCEDLEMWEKFATFVAEFKNMVMGEEVSPFFNEVKDTMQGIIKVVGVGGGGCNAVRNMYNEGVAGVTYAACNTDSQSLKGSPVPVKVLMGEGLGAGGDPEIGRSEAEKSIDSLRDVLSDGTKMVFITASMGGGTGTGSAPVVAQVAKELGLLTVGVVTIPFFFERKPKIIQALKGVDHLVDPLDNAINEKCSRIKKVFLELMDEYTASYYIISSHTQKHIVGSNRIWYERLKVIRLPRELVVKKPVKII